MSPIPCDTTSLQAVVTIRLQRLQRLMRIHIVLRLTANSSFHPSRSLQGFCSPDLPCVDQLVSDMDDKLFDCILSEKHRVLYQLLSPERHCGYSLRPRYHELCLINKSRLDEQNFMYRLLFKDVLNWTVMNRILFYILFHLSSSSFI